MSEYFPLTPGQQTGYDKFMEFYTNPLQTVMLLKGYSGTGKSTLVKTLLRDLPNMAELCRTIAPGWKEPEILMTATTNQAAESLAIATGSVMEVTTIHKALSLRVQVTNYRTKEKKLVAYGAPVERKLIFIDECSYIDQELLGKIFEQTSECKVVFIGDPAQITPINSEYMPAFELDAVSIELTDLVRFDKGPMTTIVTNMRAAVLENNWTKFKLVPGILDHRTQTEFDALALEMFSNPAQYGHVKILAYTNDRVTQYNNKLSKQLLGTSIPQVGMRMAVNEAVKNSASMCFTNESVLLTSVVETQEYGVAGWEVQLNGKGGYYFMPKHRGQKNVAHERAVLEDDYQAMKVILDTWIDLRPDFACTVNKSQGSTYDVVMVDLSDICSRVRTTNLLARMLYVGISRARSRVIFTGDLRRK